jgi:hypothetical protein
MPGQRDSGHLAVPSDIRALNRTMFSCEVGINLRANHSKGAHVSQRLNLFWEGKAHGQNAKVRTGLGKSDRPGSQGAPGKRDLWWK